MLPYFKYTEDVQSFCMLMGYTIDTDISLNANVCMYVLEGRLTPYITTFNLSTSAHPFIPHDKVLAYLTLILNGYSYEKAFNELNVVG